MPKEWLLLNGPAAGSTFWLEHRRGKRARSWSLQRAEMYRSIVEMQTELICRYRPDTTLTFVNEAYCHYFGRTRQQLLGKSFFTLLPESAHGSAQEQIDKLLTSRVPVLSEHEVFRPDGTLSWQQWLDYVIVGPDNEIVEVQAVGRDITDCRSTRLRLEQQQQELLHLSRVALLGELTGPLTHEISQPLASILSNAQATLKLLEQPAPDPESVHDIIRDIADDAERARLVIHSLRTLLYRGHSALSPVDLNDLILDTLGFMRSALQISRIQVRHFLATERPLVSADRVQLQQVILNLIVNARDAMSSIKPELRTLEITTLQTADGYVVCAIRDTGPGISAQCLPHIFEPYFSTKKDGMGLGLSISRSIITAHDGRLWADNNAGPGATFAFLLRKAGEECNARSTSRAEELATEVN